MHSVQKGRWTQVTGCSLAERLDDKVHALPTLSAVLMCQCLLPGNISDVKAAPALLEHAGRIRCRQGLMPTAFCAQCGMSMRFQSSRPSQTQNELSAKRRPPTAVGHLSKNANLPSSDSACDHHRLPAVNEVSLKRPYDTCGRKEGTGQLSDYDKGKDRI